MEHLKKTALAGSYPGLDIILQKIDYSTPKLAGVPIEGHFFQILTKNQVPMTDELANFAYNKIIDFCIPRSRYRKIKEEYEKDGDSRHILEIADEAKNTLITAPRLLKKSGESGELLLFILLENFLNAPLIANKMYLKTNKDMPVFGTDGIHMRIENDDVLSLIWGESKLDRDFSDAAGYACESISNFISLDNGSQRETEIRIIQEFCDLDNEKAKESLVEYLNPYNPKYTNCKEQYACFIGFDFNACSKGLKDDIFLDEYKKRIDSACELLNKHKCKNNLERLNFIFLLLPFDNIARFREKFYSKLGIKMENVND